LRKKWFVTTIILKCEIAGEPSIPNEWICTQQIYMLRAENRDSAYERALMISKSQEAIYLNDNGQQVSWTFVGLENLEELDNATIKDGTEIWGRVFRTNDPDSLVVDKNGLSVFYNDEIKYLKSEEIIKDGQVTKLVCNRIRL
jgi:hypothetical protein